MSDQPTYDAPPPQPASSRPQGGSGLAITALVLGIVALVFFWTVIGGLLLGLAAMVLGVVAASRARRGRATGRGMAITGAVLGLLSVLGAVVLIAFVGSLFNNEDFSNLRDCLADAGDDQAKVQQCQQDFQSDVEN